ncbi:MAG: hypothetical protein GAK30_01924 [Paracidovorax wautersii]|uniref:Type IV pilus assembly protein PilM n=1 Tax=Paracidovorax wautersii TaxID=1177982 RepID=A0A7V8JQI1_9BURK|nr:MAG: hypothetical protein GAK30_01924 [Paracidovorax wautersii]
MRSLFQRASTPVLGVDVSPSAIKVVELARLRGGAFVLRHCAIEPLARGWVAADGVFDAFEAIAAALRRAVLRSGSRARQAVLALPSSGVLTRRIVLPASLHGPALAARVEAEASQSMPFPVEDVSLDFYPADAPDLAADSQAIWVAACRRDRVQDCAGLAEAASLEATVVDVDSHAARRAAWRLAQATGVAAASHWALVEIGARRTTLHVLQGDEVLHERDHAFGGESLTQRLAGHYGFTPEEAERQKREAGLPDDVGRTVLPPYHQALAHDIARGLREWLTAVPASPIRQILLAGGGAAPVGLAQTLAALTACDCRRADPFAGMTLGPGVDAEALHAQAPSYLTACGLALRGLGA